MKHKCFDDLITTAISSINKTVYTSIIRSLEAYADAYGALSFNLRKRTKKNCEKRNQNQLLFKYLCRP